jgi:hypothetical protein
MDITKLTLDEFMCRGKSSMADDRPGTFEHDQAVLQPKVGALVRRLNDQYALHRIDTGREGDVGILSNGELVAFYVDQLIAVSADHQGKALAIPMVLEGTRFRTLPTSRSHTAAGKRTFEKAWRIAHGLEPNPWP